MEPFRLILADLNPGLCAAFGKYFADLPDVEVVNDYFENLPEFDCMVSAANSFGLMDGGVDLAIIRYFGLSLQAQVQERILKDYLGEQPVGTSFIIGTENARHPFLAHTPTMRVPMTIARTDNVYCAMRAMLLAVRQHNAMAATKIASVACPGLGTATGQVPYGEAAYQMALAYRNFLNPPQSIHWDYAVKRQEAVRFGGDAGMNLPPKFD